MLFSSQFHFIRKRALPDGIVICFWLGVAVVARWRWKKPGTKLRGRWRVGTADEEKKCWRGEEKKESCLLLFRGARSFRRCSCRGR